VSSVDIKTLVGRTVEVKGAFTYDEANPRELVVTPVIMKAVRD
jgi:predicted lipoprotein